SSILRKVFLVSKELKDKEFIKWVEKELNGYNDGDEVPNYRIISIIPKGHFVGLGNSQLNNVELPISLIQKEHPDYIENVSRLYNAISELEDLISNQS